MNLVVHFSVKIFGFSSIRILFIKMSGEYVTLSTLREMLEIQDKAYKFAIKTFLEEMRVDVKDIRQEVNELKVSVNFANPNYDDMRKKHTNMETEIKAVYHQIKGLNQNLNNGIEALESKKIIPDVIISRSLG